MGFVYYSRFEIILMESMEITPKEKHQKEVQQLCEEIQKAHERARGALFTLDITRSQRITDGKLTMDFHLRPNLAKKTTGAPTPDFNPFLNPSPELLIKELGATHRLLFNKFNIYHNHLLVVTREFQSQKEPISHGDMLFAGMACEALRGIVFFNGGEISGASQPHKHLQILPSKAREMPIFSEMLLWAEGTSKDRRQKEMIQFEKFDFLHGVVVLDDSGPFQPIGERLHRAYQLLYGELIAKNREKYGVILDYNMVACESFILLAVREKECAFNEVSVNSVGFMGSLLFKNQEIMEKFMKEYEPSKILADISKKKL